MPATNQALKDECRRFRKVERLSYAEITARTGVPKGTLSGWLRDLPLTKGEIKAKRDAGRYRTPKKDRGEESLLHQMVPASGLSGHTKGKVAETAVLLRLALHGVAVYGSPFDGDGVDWVADGPTGLLRIQVKWAAPQSDGLPVVPLRRTTGHRDRRAYWEDEMDVLVGYDLFTDTCYVWAWDEVKHLKSGISVCPEAAERWDKMGL